MNKFHLEIGPFQFTTEQNICNCVPSCLFSLLSYQGCFIDYLELTKELKTNLYGTDLLDVFSFLIKRKLNFFIFLGDLVQITKLLESRIPLLVWVKKENFLHTKLVYGMELNNGYEKFLIFDPGNGCCKVESSVLLKEGNYKCFDHRPYFMVINPENFDVHDLEKFCQQDPFYLNMLGEIAYYLNNDSEKALEKWKKSIFLNSEYAEVYNNVATCLNDRNPELALYYAKKAVNIDPNDVDFAVTLAEIYLKLKDKNQFFSIISNLNKDRKNKSQIKKLLERGAYVFK